MFYVELAFFENDFERKAKYCLFPEIGRILSKSQVILRFLARQGYSPENVLNPKMEVWFR